MSSVALLAASPVIAHAPAKGLQTRLLATPDVIVVEGIILVRFL